MIIISPDHGNSITENCSFGYRLLLRDAITRVSMIIKYPRNKWNGRVAFIVPIAMLGIAGIFSYTRGSENRYEPVQQKGTEDSNESVE